MLIELGNSAAKSVDADGDRVTYVHVPDEAYELDASGFDARDVALHLLQAPGGITHLPGLEPLLAVAHPGGLWAAHGDAQPTWVHCESHPEIADLLSQFYNCPVGRPDDLEDTHWTRSGMPGVGGYDPLEGVTALKTNAGNDIQAHQMFGFATVFGQAGTATATSATSLTGGTETPGGSHASNDAAGMIITAGTVYGLVLSNTTGTSPVYTVDRWYAPGTPGGAAGSTPGSSATYVLAAASPPAWFMGLTANGSAAASGDTTLTGEITTSGGGLIRKICVLAHTAGTNTQTLTPVFTANGTDSLPVTIHKIGVSQSILSGANQLFQTVLNADATLAASGDQLTVTETVTM